MADVLVDTSVWVDYLRSGDSEMTNLLNSNRVVMHPMIIGELACGYLNNRKSLLALWSSLNSVPSASHNEVLYFIEHHQLMGKGIGYVDAHLLASVSLTTSTSLWTLDKRLARVTSSMTSN